MTLFIGCNRTANREIAQGFVAQFERVAAKEKESDDQVHSHLTGTPPTPPRAARQSRGYESLVMALEGWISPEEFFNPENLKRIFANAAASSVLPNQHVGAEAHLL